MATQTEPRARSNKSTANSHSHNGGAPHEVDTTALLKLSRPFVDELSADRRRELIEVAAYYLAERRNFEPGHETEDWLTAESQVRSLGTEIY